MKKIRSRLPIVTDPLVALDEELVILRVEHRTLDVVAREGRDHGEVLPPRQGRDLRAAVAEASGDESLAGARSDSLGGLRLGWPKSTAPSGTSEASSEASGSS